MEQALLEGVLGGRVELSVALAWAVGECGDPAALLGLPAAQGAPPARPEDFRVHVLNAVREQAELVLAAAEQEASGGGGSSQPPTPQAVPRLAATDEARNAAGQQASAAAQAAVAAATAAQQRRASGGGGGGGGGGNAHPPWPPRSAAPHQQQQQKQQQQPGQLDDLNFPTLGAASSSSSGGRRNSGPWGSPAKPAPQQQRQGGQRGQQQQQAQGQGQQQAGQNQKGGRRRTIVPAKVASLDVDPAFQLQPPAQLEAPAPAQQAAPAAAGFASSGAEAPQPQAQARPQQAQQAAAAPASPLQRRAMQPPAGRLQQPAEAQQQQGQGQGQEPGAAAAPPPAQQQQQQGPGPPSLALPMSPPPVAVRLQAPGAALAASLLARGGAGAAGSPKAGAGSAGNTPKRITPIRMQQPAEVQQTFVTALPGASLSPRSARLALLGDPELQQARSRAGSRLGTPMAASAAAASAATAFAPEAALAAVASLAGRPGSSSSAKGSGGSGSGSGGAASSRSPLLWSTEEQSTICQQLSFDTLTSPAKPAVAEGAAAGAGLAATQLGSPDAGPAASKSKQMPAPLESLKAAPSGSGSTAGGPEAAPSSKQQRLLEAAARRMAPEGGSSSSGGFDAPKLSASATRPLSLGSSGGSGAPAPLGGQPQPAQLSEGRREQQEGAAAAAAAVIQLTLPSPAANQPAAAPAPELAVPGQDGPGPQLCPEGRRLAELHAALLRCCSSINLSGELDLLLNLLAVPDSCRIDPALTAVTRLWCGALAQQYACCVLQSAGGLIRGLGPQLLANLAGLPLVRAAFPRLHAEMQQALQHFASTQLHTEKAYRQVKAASGMLSLHGLAALTSDGRRSRSQEEQRRISNRESCRDEWFNLMREAAAQTHSFAARQLGRLAAAASDRLSDSGRTAATSAGADEAGLLALMQHSATDLLRRLRPDNFGPFAELFTAAVLQAAATGETLLDEELSSLARQNVGRFHSLNQRLQAQGAAVPSRGGAARLQSNQPMTAAGFGRSSSSGGGSQAGRWGAANGRSGLPGASRQQQRGGTGSRFGGASGPGGLGADEAVAESLRLVAEFPRPQRLYVLFLEAADSHRLNSHLIRCMTGKLRALTAGEHTGAGLSERVAAVSTLATFLSYLTFTRAGYTGPSQAADGSSPSAAWDSSHPVDALSALEAAMKLPDGSHLAWTVPWAVQYLWFLKWDAEAAQAPYFSHLLRRLARLHGAPELRPQQARFGLAAFCLRSVLDEFAERLGPELMPQPDSSIVDGQHDSSREGSREGGREGGEGQPRPATCPALSSLAAVDGQLDTRFLHLCCPALEHARQLFAAGSGGGAGTQQAQQGRRVKKIRPTAPAGAARAALAAAGASSAAVAGGGGSEAGRDLLKLQLQRAFLEQYSSDEHKVKLKDVVDYVSDILAHNCASSAADALLSPAGDAMAAALREAAAAVAPPAGADGAAQAHPGAPRPSQLPGRPPQQQQQQQALDPGVRLYFEALAEQQIAQHTADVLARAQAAAKERIQAGAVQALAALTAPEHGPAVIGTAAAIAAEAACAAAEQRLRAQVPSSLRRSATDALQQVLAALARGGSGGGGGVKGGAARPAVAVAVPGSGAGDVGSPGSPEGVQEGPGQAP